MRALGLLKTRFVSLPNVLADDALVPELLQDDWVVNFRPDERGAFIANLFGRHGLQAPAHKIHLAHSPTLMLTLVQQSDMLSFCPWPLVETMELRDKLVALPLREQFQVNTAGIVRRAQEAPQPAARKAPSVGRNRSVHLRNNHGCSINAHPATTQA